MDKNLALAVYRAAGSYEELANAYGVSISSIHNIKRGVTWARVTGHVPEHLVAAHTFDGVAVQSPIALRCGKCGKVNTAVVRIGVKARATAVSCRIVCGHCDGRVEDFVAA